MSGIEQRCDVADHTIDEAPAMHDAMGRQLLLRLRSAETALAHAQEAHQNAQAALHRHLAQNHSAAEAPACRSDIHAQRGEDGVLATHRGTFDCSALNGKPAESNSWYCIRCATALAEIGYFTPDDGQPALGSLADLVKADSATR